MNSAPTSLSSPPAVIVVATCWCASAKCSLRRRKKERGRERENARRSTEPLKAVRAAAFHHFLGHASERAASHTCNRRPRYRRSKRIPREFAETAETASHAHVGTPRLRVGGPSSLPRLPRRVHETRAPRYTEVPASTRSTFVGADEKAASTETTLKPRPDSNSVRSKRAFFLSLSFSHSRGKGNVV